MRGALGLVFRATLRHGWGGMLAIAVLVAVTGGVVLTGVEAARRTSTAFDRMREATDAWDVLVNPDYGVESQLTMEDVAALPEVAEVGRVDGLIIGSAELEEVQQLDDSPLTIAVDGVSGYDFARFQLLEGRMPSPDAADEVLLSPGAADELGLGVGDTYEARVLRFEDFGAMGDVTADEFVDRYNELDLGTVAPLTVTGIGVPIDELVVDEFFQSGSVILPPGFVAEHGREMIGFFGLQVRLAPGATADELRAAVEGLVDEPIAFQSSERIEEQVDRAVGPEVRAILIFSLIAALVALVVVGQAVSRRLQLDAVSDRPLRALGLSRGQRAALGVGRMAIAGMVGGLAAVGIAVVASPIGPVGVIRPAEPDPGVHVDVPVLVLGWLAIVVGTTLVSVWPALRASRLAAPGRARAGALSSALVRWGSRPPVVMGARFALEPGPSAVPTRSTLVGAATGVVLVAATATFGANLDHFVDTPALYGNTWSNLIGLSTVADEDLGAEAMQPVLDQLLADDRVDAASLVVPGQLALDDTTVPAFSLSASDRPVTPAITEGAAPEADDELVLGPATLDRLGVEVGDVVEVTGPDDDVGELRVVGQAVLPVVAAYPGADKTTLGEGAVMTADGLARWSPPFAPEGLAISVDGDEVADVADGLALDPSQYALVDETGLPSDVASLGRLRSTPFLLTGLLVLLIAVTVTHALGAAVRARRRELAVLRTFGFSRRQVIRSVAVQASLIALVGLVVGLPLGIAAGRLLWTWVAESRDALVSLVTPWAGLLVVGVAVLALANLAGLWPGLRAARARPATILRTE